MAVVLGEFAVNPACISTSADLSLALKVFGFEHGAVISDFPNGWQKIVRACSSQMPEPDRGIFLGKLNLLRDKAVARVRASEQGGSWIEQAAASAARRPFRAILDETASAESACYAEAIDDANFRVGLRETKVPRSADALIRSFWPLVVSSDRFTIIDPYFKPDNAHLNFVSELISARRTAGNAVLFLDFHIEFDARPAEMRDGSDACKRSFDAWARRVGANLVLSIHWWSDNGLGELHPRYLLTERGGVRLDRGALIPPELGQQDHDTDVSMLADHFIAEVEHRYNGTYHPLELKAKYTIRV